MPVRTMCLLTLALATVLLGGCDQNAMDAGRARLATPPPAFLDVARAHNAEAERLSQFWAACAVVFTDTDADGALRSTQGEGNLMLLAPSGVALRLGKLGETLLWVGCDQERYWLFDFTAKDRRTLVTGRHNALRPRGAPGGLVASLPTRLLPELMGIAPMAEAQPGATQWSSDGRLLGVTRERTDAPGRIRTWLDPESLLPMKVEVFDLSGRAIVVSDLREHDYVLISNQGLAGPRVAKVINIGVQDGAFQADLHLDRLEDGRARGNERAKLTPRSFDLAELIAGFGPTERLDADAPAPVEGR